MDKEVWLIAFESSIFSLSFWIASCRCASSADIFPFGIFPGRKLVQLNRLGNLSMTLVHPLLLPRHHRGRWRISRSEAPHATTIGVAVFYLGRYMPCTQRSAKVHIATSLSMR